MRPRNALVAVLVRTADHVGAKLQIDLRRRGELGLRVDDVGAVGYAHTKRGRRVRDVKARETGVLPQQERAIVPSRVPGGSRETVAESRGRGGRAHALTHSSATASALARFAVWPMN